MVYVRPLLEYCTPVWCPCNKGDINTIERVQCAFTRKIFYSCHLPPVSYEDCLLHLGLQRLEIRRIHNDLIFLFKINMALFTANCMTLYSSLTLCEWVLTLEVTNTNCLGHVHISWFKVIFLLIAFYLFGMALHHHVLTLTGYLLLDGSCSSFVKGPL